MIRFIYNLVWPLGLVFFLPGYLVKMFRRGGYRHKFGQRFGFYDGEVRKRLADERPIWLHAVSVGEVSVALKLVAALRPLCPGRLVVLTTTTTTGFAFARSNAPESVEVMYSPLDFWPVMQRAFTVIRPERIGLIEAEVWPNLVARASRELIPVCLINARLSPRSEQRFRRFNRIVRPTFRLLDVICVQNVRDLERWVALGVERDRLACSGSVKYDPEDVEVDESVPRALLAQLQVATGQQVLLGGSTHHGEEATLARIFMELRRTFPDLFLIVAPRHVERSTNVQSSLQQLGLHVALRSEVAKPNSEIDCLVIDTTGELRHWYAVATVIFIGKSLTAHGGQNPAEAIIAGKPLVYGVHMENFSGLADILVDRGGAVQVDSARQLERTLRELLSDSQARERLVQNARAVLAEHRGATARTAELFVNLMKR